MIVHRSNRTEALVDALAEVVARPPADPLAAETIAVQGRGMARWLGLELARRFGVWANASFPFPRTVIEAAATAVLGDAPEAAARFAPETLRWAVAAELAARRAEPAFAPLAAYLGDDRGGGRLLGLSARIADLFDQYAVFRPRLVDGWERGAAGDDWQAPLWRALVTRLGRGHPAARVAALLAALGAGRAPAAPFPRRISLFGLATLPPLYVDVLVALAAHVELHLFVLSPSDLYWGDLATSREALRARARAGGLDPEALHLDDGHPLLASLGRVGRDFQQVLESRADYQEHACEVDPGTASALAVLQGDLRALRRRTAPERVPLAADDDSIALHACHAPMREVEVLHDQLAALLRADPTLAPHDIVVLAPSIETYAPLIDAVFGAPDRPVIPYRVADRPARATHDVVDAFLRALELLPGRLPATAVLDLLALAPVRARFAVELAQLERVRRWVQESGIRWGADAAHRAEEGQPPCLEHTWRFGLDRLLLGVALPDAGDGLFGETLPYADVEGDDAALLGRVATFIETLLQARRALAAPRPPAAWRADLGALLAALLAVTPATAFEHEQVLAALADLDARAAAGGFSGALDLDTMRHLLAEALEQGGAPRGFLTGAVTLCQMVPMRTIPFRVVCLLGLSDGTFPRVRRPLGFDLMARRPQVGDRSARDDDRYLFLEALLAARQRLLITYVGQSISDNTPLPPSAVVSELLDACAATFALPGDAGGEGGEAVRRRLVVRHPLQPFSREYFRAAADPLRQPRLTSFALSHFHGAVALEQPPQPPPPFIGAALAEVPPPARVALDDLIACLSHPARWFLRRRLGLFLDDRDGGLDDREPGELDSLEQWQIGSRLLARALAGADPAAAWPLLRAEGLLPPGAAGRHVVETLAARVALLAQQVRGPARAPLSLDLIIETWRVEGALADLTADGQVVAQFSRVGGYRELALWVRHLALNAVEPGTRSVLVGRARQGDGVTRVAFAPVADAGARLADLLALYGAAHVAPLRLFRYASRAYAEARFGGRQASAAAALTAALARYAQNAEQGPGGDATDPYVAQVHGADAEQTLQGDGATAFAALAERVYGPLFAHREET